MANITYSSDPQILGSDVLLVTGDLTANNRADLKLISGIDNVVEAFRRVLTTPYGYIAKFSYTNMGIAAHDEDYGFGGWLLLSEPLTTEWMDKIKEYITLAANSQPRIVLVTVESTIVSTAPVRVIFDITFKVQNSLNNLSIVVSNQGVLVVQ